jgi:hypothetical protein
MTHLAAAVIVAVPFTIWVAGIAYIMTTSQDTRVGLSTDTTLSLFWYQQDGACPHTVNVIMDVLHNVFGSPVLINLFPECFMCEWPWPLCSLNMNPCNHFFGGYLKDHVYCTNPHTVQDMQVETQAAFEVITSDMLCDTVDNSVVC